MPKQNYTVKFKGEKIDPKNKPTMTFTRNKITITLPKVTMTRPKATIKRKTMNIKKKK